MYNFVLPNFESQLMLFSRIIVGFYVCVWEKDCVCVCDGCYGEMSIVEGGSFMVVPL